MNGVVEERLLALSRDLGGPLLALETSGPATSLCAVNFLPGEVAERTLSGRALPSESISLAIAAEFSRTGIEPARLRAIVLGLGPGSFTGLRVGLAFAKGLAFGANIPVLGVSSLAIVAGSAGCGNVAVVRDARRGDIFGALYEVTATHVKAIEDDGIFTPEAFVARVKQHARPSVLWVTDDARAETVQAMIPEPVSSLRELHATVAFTVAAEALSARQFADLETLTPRYLRASEAERAHA